MCKNKSLSETKQIKHSITIQTQQITIKTQKQYLVWDSTNNTEHNSKTPLTTHGQMLILKEFALSVKMMLANRRLQMSSVRNVFPGPKHEKPACPWDVFSEYTMHFNVFHSKQPKFLGEPPKTRFLNLKLGQNIEVLSNYLKYCII